MYHGLFVYSTTFLKIGLFVFNPFHFKYGCMLSTISCVLSGMPELGSKRDGCPFPGGGGEEGQKVPFRF